MTGAVRGRLLRIIWFAGFFAALAVLPVVKSALAEDGPSGESQKKENILTDSLFVPGGFGINIHTHASFPYTLRPQKDVGFTVVRTNLYWYQVEKEKGKYEWRDYDKLMLEMKKQGLRPLLVLSFSNSLYARSKEIVGLDGKTIRKTYAPANDVIVEAFANFSAEAAKRYKENNVIWEIWNEPDYAVFWVPKPDAAAYDRLASRTCQAIKAVDPAAIVIGPSSSGTPHEADKAPWWQGFLKGRAIDCLDAISFHPYVHNTNKGPEINFEKYDLIRRQVSERTDRKIPLMSSEFGFSTSDWAVTRERQAALMLRNYMVNLMTDVKVSIWYDWSDDGMDPKNREHNFGFITRKMVKKPLYYAAQTLNRTLNGYTLERRLMLDGSTATDPDATADPYLLLFRHPSKPPVIVAWRSDKHVKDFALSLDVLGGKPPKVIDYVGKATDVAVKDGKLLLKLGEFPIYISADNL